MNISFNISWGSLGRTTTQKYTELSQDFRHSIVYTVIDKTDRFCWNLEHLGSHMEKHEEIPWYQRFGLQLAIKGWQKKQPTWAGNSQPFPRKFCQNGRFSQKKIKCSFPRCHRSNDFDMWLVMLLNNTIRFSFPCAVFVIYMARNFP